MSNRGTESEFELATIERMEDLGYRHVFGFDIERALTEVVLRDKLLESFCAKPNPTQLPGLPVNVSEAVTV